MRMKESQITMGLDELFMYVIYSALSSKARMGHHHASLHWLFCSD